MHKEGAVENGGAHPRPSQAPEQTSCTHSNRANCGATYTYEVKGGDLVAGLRVGELAHEHRAAHLGPFACVQGNTGKFAPHCATSPSVLITQQQQHSLVELRRLRVLCAQANKAGNALNVSRYLRRAASSPPCWRTAGARASRPGSLHPRRLLA